MSFKSIELRPCCQQEDFVLEALEIGLSSNCNFRCDYCCAYNLNDHKFLRGEKVNELLEDAPDLKRVKLSGGEVLIYFDECVKVIEYCRARGIATQVNTNGSLLNEKKIGTLEAAGLDCLHFSFNFCESEGFCNYYRQRPEVYERIQENLSLAAASSIETVAETVMFTSTEDTILEIHKHLFDLGVRRHEIQNGIPIAARDWDEVLPRERIEALIEKLIANRIEDMSLFFSCVDIEPQSEFYGRVIEHIQRGGVHFPSCIEGRSQLHVHSNGDVLICELGHPEVIGNLHNGVRLRTILQDRPAPLAEFLERKSQRECGCKIRTLVQPEWVTLN